MFNKLLGTIVVACTLMLSQTIFAHDSSLCGDRMNKMLESMKLDDAQKAKIMPVLMQLKSATKDSWSQMKDLDEKIKQQIQSPTMDQAVVDGLVDKKAQLIGMMMKAKIMAKNQIINMLTPEQKTEILNKMKEAEEKIAAKFKDCHE